VYETAINELIRWCHEKQILKLSPIVLADFQAHLLRRHRQSKGAVKPGLRNRTLRPSSINVKLSAIRALVNTATALGLLAVHDAGEILHFLKTRPDKGTHYGNPMTQEEVLACLKLPDQSTLMGLRDYAILAVLFSCGLRRAELCNLEVKSIGTRDGGWALIDIIGKREKVRSVPINESLKTVLERWLTASGIESGCVFRAINIGKAGKQTYWGSGLNERTVWDIVTKYSNRIRPNFAPHDARRTCARLLRSAGGPLEQIQMLLGHDSLDTTNRYLSDKQGFGKDSVTLKVNLIVLETNEEISMEFN
jgi:site-specific recombinase XerD